MKLLLCRTIILYLCVLFAMRLMGKRQLGELQPEELVSTIHQNALRMLRLTTADLMEALRGKDIFDPRKVSYAVIETNGTLSAALRPEQEAATLSDLQLKVQQTQATIPFVLDGQVLEDNLRWCGKDRAWLERTAMANTVLPQEILLLIGNETEDYFLLKKEGRQPGGKR